jgi:hypothetical protein
VADDPSPRGSFPLTGVDCPDGLARCSGGIVETSRLASIPQRCNGPPERCGCPWERAGDCDRTCVADGVEFVVPHDRAISQLCAPAPDEPLSMPAPPDVVAFACDEGERYRCQSGLVVACAGNAVIGRCVRACVFDVQSVDDDSVSREGAFAILCTR